MASLRPFLSITPLSHAPKPTRLANSLLLLAPSSSSSSPPFKLIASRKRLAVRGGAEAAAPIGDPKDDDDRSSVFVPATDEEVSGGVAAEYDWTEEWYPLYLTRNVPEDAPLGLTVFDKQLVLYRDGTSELRCHEDRCPHRLAKLSEGQLIDGKLECLYHGWQFEGEGKCVKIPQANPMKLASRIKKIRDDISTLKEQCREVLMAKQDVIDKARTVLVGNRNMLQKMQASMGIPFVSDLDDPAFAPFKQIIEEWTTQVQSKIGEDGQDEADSNDVNKLLFSAVVQA